MPPTLNIIFKDNFKLFSPGQPVSGYVEIFSGKPFSCKAVSIKVYGIAQVNFQETESKLNVSSRRDDFTELVDYFSNEEYYSLSYKLWGDGINCNKFGAGARQLPFTFVLPPLVPSSFESESGFVRHTCDAMVALASPFSSDITFSAPITVMAAYDLNNDPLSCEPISVMKEKVLYNFMFKSGPISFTVNIDHSGYVPGENIIINAVCSNKSNKSMTKSRAEVVQIIQYKAQGKNKTEERVVCFKEHPALPAGGDNMWESETLLIPNVPPSHLHGCSIIDIKYIFVFQFIPSGLSITLESRNDLVIGTIPLQNVFSQTPASMHQVNYAAQQNPGSSLPPYMPYNNVASTYPRNNDGASAPPVEFSGSEVYPPFPPSYEESMSGPKVVSLEDFQYDCSDDDDEHSHFPSKAAYPNLKASKK